MIRTFTTLNPLGLALVLGVFLVGPSLAQSSIVNVPTPSATSQPQAEPPEPDAPPVVRTQIQTQPVAPPAATASGLETCRARLAELSAHNAILFRSGAAIIAESAAAELEAFAQALAQCPDAPINVEGHTDSDGDDAKNLALSVARAEAVVGALVERGVAMDRLYAIGFGESQPVADNDTPEGKHANRRIVITIATQD